MTVAPTVPPPAPYRFGPSWLGDGRVAFRLWAPDAAAQGHGVRLEVAGLGAIRMAQAGGGWFEAATACCEGARYWFRLDDGSTVPDPASRRQAVDVDGASVLCRPGVYRWAHPAWHGRPWHEAVIYELHAGLCGGFDGVRAELPRLAALGFTAIELMPVAEFPGHRNWGYDGVLPFAPECGYGTPDALRALVDAAHGLGIMVLQDVVYNHFGPSGNFLHRYASAFFRHDRHTPWGPAIDFREPEVRAFFSENARYWLEEFRFDGLRLDAVHAIDDEGWLPELAADLRARLPGRHFHLVLENDHNDAALIAAGFDAQWNDDAHHAWHVLLTGERDGYYVDYIVPPGGEPGPRGEGPARRAAIGHLARVLAEGFAWQGEVSPYRSAAGRPVRRGQPSAHLPPTAFVTFLQNHDQTGNRAFGERLVTMANPAALRAAVAMQLLCPQIPLVFMGEEAGVETPFLYFTDHPHELAAAVREGRRREFAATAAFRDPARAAAIPDPNARETFAASRPVAPAPETGDTWSRYYGELLDIRRRELVPRLPGCRADGAAVLGEAALVARWRLADGATLAIWLNLGTEPVGAGETPVGSPLHESAAGALGTLRGGTLAPMACVTCLLPPAREPS